MKGTRVLSALLFTCCRTALGNSGFISRRERIKQDWVKYVADYKNADDAADDEDEFGDVEIGEITQLNMRKLPSADDVDEHRASCTFDITKTIDRDNFLAAIVFSPDVYGVMVDRTFNVLLPRSALGGGQLPSGAKIYRITNGETLPPQLITLNFTLFKDLAAPPT